MNLDEFVDTPLRVGCVSYINALPLHLPFTYGHVRSTAQFTYAVPSVLNPMLREERLDLALTSCVEYLDGNYNLLPRFGIVGLNQVLSVNLYTRRPITALQGARIGLSPQSATSVSLLKVLCQHHWKISPQWEKEPLTAYDAFLLIGDEALEKHTVPGFQTIDLAAAWYEMTGLPFVFALFMARKEVSPTQLDQFQQELEQAITWSAAHSKKIESAAMQQCRLTRQRSRAYYATLGYRLGGKEMESLELFRKLRLKHEI